MHATVEPQPQRRAPGRPGVRAPDLHAPLLERDLTQHAVLFRDAPDHGAAQRALGIESDKTPGKKVYDPGNPDADRKGYVTMSNVNPVTEMVDLITATRGYEADTTAIKAVEGMAQHAMDVIR